MNRELADSLSRFTREAEAQNSELHERDDLESDPQEGEGPRLLSPDVCEDILKRVEQAISGRGKTSVFVNSMWSGELRWARNRASMTSDRRNIQVFVSREIGGGLGSAMTNQIDPISLEGVVQSAERQAMRSADQRALDIAIEFPIPTLRKTTTWSDATFDQTVEANAQLVHRVTTVAESKELMSAGYIEMAGSRLAFLKSDEYSRKQQYLAEFTQAQCSTTVRHPQGTSSGWAGLAGYDFGKFDGAAIAARALDKCIASFDPVRVEPGRYTAILEPQAVSDLAELIIGAGTNATYRVTAENSGSPSPFRLGYDESISRMRSKLGMRVIDDRITISHDPSDPELGIVPTPGAEPITWIERGVLKTMEYERSYALNELNEDTPALKRISYRMSGGNSTVDDMIASTKRGLLVTRFSSVNMIDRGSLLATGVTRDGLWLVENGKITKAVRNFRFTESPLFAFNNVEQLGIPVPVYQPFEYPEMTGLVPLFALTQVIVPAMKVNDFSFTATIDAI